MIKLENVHKAMNDPQVQEVAHGLHFAWIFREPDEEDFSQDPALVRQCVVSMFSARAKLLLPGYTATPTEEQLLATERLFQIKVETGQAWHQ